MSIQSPISIGRVVRNAHVFNVKNWQAEERMSTDSLLEIVERLFTMLHERNVDYLLVGGIAMLQYVEGRNTEDIDLIIALSSLQILPEIEVVSQDNNFVRGEFEALQVDLLLSHNPLFEKVQKQYKSILRFQEEDIPCATVEGLLLLKLYALPSLYRQGNFARVGLYENDIATLIQAYQPNLSPLFDELAHHLSESDLDSVRQIVAEIERRIARFRKGLEDNNR